MRKIIGVSALTLLAGITICSAQTYEGSRYGRQFRHQRYARTVPPSGAVIADERAGTVVTPRNDPDSTNVGQNTRPGVYHEEIAPGGVVTGPLSPPANGD
jgi:hypothetical protein